MKKDLTDYREQEFKTPKQESNDERALAPARTDKEKTTKEKSENLKQRVMDLEQMNQDLEYDIKDTEAQDFATLHKMESMNEEISDLKET